MVGPNFGLLENDNSIFVWSHDSVDKFGIVVIPITMWSIWCARNANVFDFFYQSNENKMQTRIKA